MMRKLSVLFSAAALLAAQAVAQSVTPVSLEDGTPVRLRTVDTISSADAHTDDRVNFEVVDDVKVGNTILIQHGTTAIGTVTQAQPKGRMGKGGKLNVNIDSTKTITGEKVALRGVKDMQGGGHTGAMIGTAIVFWPAAPLFLFMHGKDITVPKGHEFTVYTSGSVTSDATKLAVATQSGPTGANPAAVSTASLAVSSIPTGAEISVDGAFVGSTPSSVPVSMGNHTISVKKTGYNSWDRTIRVSGGTVSVAAELTRPSRASR